MKLRADIVVFLAYAYGVFVGTFWNDPNWWSWVLPLPVFGFILSMWNRVIVKEKP